MQIAVTGATGFIGRRLVSLLEKEGVQYRIISRNQDAARRMFPGAARVVGWNPPFSGPPPETFDGLDAVIHLSGTTVARRWSPARKREIRDSRVLSTRLLVSGLAGEPARVRVLVSASAIGYYGPRGDETLDEGSPSGDDFLAEVCREWEGEAAKAAESGIRVVMPRTGIVLGRNGGALAQMLLPFKMGLGGPIGTGNQWMSWIHIDDLAFLYLHGIRSDAISGPMNATAPEPVTNRDFARVLGRTLKRPAFLPTPPFALRLAFGEFADILATGQRVIPAKALTSGFRYAFGGLDAALANILKR